MKTIIAFVGVFFFGGCAATEKSCLQPLGDLNRLSGSLSGLRILVVGGTDGSGTRGVVDLLERLGVPIVVDDHLSKDIHAQEIGGWPSVVGPLLMDQRQRHETTGRTLVNDVSQPTQRLDMCSPRSVEFPPRAEKMPPQLASSTTEALLQLVATILAKSNVLPPRAPGSGGESSDQPSPSSSWHPTVAFKAPVAMAVVPHLVAMGASVRFLHVVRDGRDIALSSNRSPVLKFFNQTFPGDACWAQSAKSNNQGGKHAHSMRAARLWAAWNHQQGTNVLHLNNFSVDTGAPRA